MDELKHSTGLTRREKKTQQTYKLKIMNKKKKYVIEDK